MNDSSDVLSRPALLYTRKPIREEEEIINFMGTMDFGKSAALSI